MLRIVDRFGLTEVDGAEGGPYLALEGNESGVGGVCRVWIGDNVERVVYLGLTNTPSGLDSHVIFAFAPTTSALPHFTLDAVSAASGHAFHLDLIPRVDLVSNLGYMDAVFVPLTRSFEAARSLEGLTRAKLGPRQIALMSPWLLAFRATNDAFGKIDTVVNAYHEHWADLVEKGLDDTVAIDLEEARLAERDARHRAALFDPEVDPVWNQVAAMVGEDKSARLRALLRNEE